MKKAFLAVFMLTISSIGMAQSTETINQQEITSIRPADGKPATFPSQQELNDKIAFKIENIKGLIRNNANNPVKLEALRKDLWRFENAIVVTPKN